MRLKLVILNHDQLPNGASTRFEIDGRSAIIGRSPKVDWTLPDAKNIISAHHCAISFRGGQYFLTDVSTNGTLVNGKPLVGQHRLVDGDTIAINQYRIAATVEMTPEAPATADSGRQATAPVRAGATSKPTAPVAPAVPETPPVPATPAPARGDDVWQRMAAENAVDWARGGFGVPYAQADAPHSNAPLQAEPMTDVFLAAAGLVRSDIKTGDAALQATVGRLVKRLVSGLVVMLEARARAKSQMGAQPTNLEFEGNNPLKFARTPEQALTQLINPPERGYMASDSAIEDAFLDLQAHQLATLKAMQGALRSTLDRFSPTAIRQRGKANGLLSRLMPTARDAALWRAYEKDFGGVASGSDEAFMQVFGMEFRNAYEEQMRAQEKRG